MSDVGLFDILFGKADPPLRRPRDRLRDELFAAVRAGDSRRLERLTPANRTVVLEHFRSWQRVPA